MEAKHRVKMHKVKKHWVAIGMTVLALTSLGAVKVSADETSPVAQADSTSQVQPSANKPVATIDTTASVDKLDNQAEESTNQSDTSSDTTVKASDLADSVPMDQAIPVAETNNGTANSDKQATPADQTQPQAQPTNTEQPATERLQVNPNLPKGTSYRGFHEVNGKTYYFNDQGDAVANQFVTYHYISPTLIDPYNSPHFEVNHYYYYYLDGDGQKVGGWLSLNNERYYFDLDNYQQYRNTVKKIGESVYTFDNEGRVVPNDSPDIGVSFTVPLYLKADESGKKFLYVRTSDYKITNQKGITKFNGAYYYFADDGVVFTGPQKVGDKEYRIDGEGKIVAVVDKDDNITTASGEKFESGEIHYSSDATVCFFVTSENKLGREIILEGSINDYYAFMRVKSHPGPFYFDQDGKAYSGLLNRNGEILYFADPFNAAVKNTTKTIDGKTYTFNQNGRATSIDGIPLEPPTTAGWHRWDRERYYGDGQGHNLTGFQTIEGKPYYFQNDGRLVENQFFSLDNGSTWYCASEDTGEILNGLAKFHGDTYLFRPDGSQVKGTYGEFNGNWYYLDKDNGQPLKFWQTIDGTLRFFDDQTGVQAKNGIYTIEGTQLRFDENGNPFTLDGKAYSLPTGFYTRSGKTYYRNEDGSNATGFKTIDGNLYFFDDDDYETGQMYQNDDKSTLNGSYYFGPDGKAVKGWYIVRNNKYYFDDNYRRVDNGFRKINGKLYYFGFYDHVGDTLKGQYKADGYDFYYFDKESGQALTGWQTIDGLKRHFDENGVQSKNGFYTIENNAYYFDEDGTPASNQYKEIQGNWYYFNKDGHMLTGWQTIDGTKRYFDEKGVQAKNTELTIDGVSYHFDGGGNPSKV